MYKLKHFSVYELVDQETFELLGNNAQLLFDQDLLRDIDTLRENINRKCTINDWYWGGKFSQSGYRTLKSVVGSKTSQHRLGKAFDLKFEKITAEEVRKHIIANKHLYPAIMRLERGVSWIHLDGKLVANSKRIYLFNP